MSIAPISCPSQILVHATQATLSGASHLLCLICCLQRALGIFRLLSSWAWTYRVRIGGFYGLIRSRFRSLLSEAMRRAERAPFPFSRCWPGVLSAWGERSQQPGPSCHKPGRSPWLSRVREASSA